jgi:hypothetical protein
MDMCQLHKNFVGRNTECPECANERKLGEKLKIPTGSVSNIIEDKNRLILELTDTLRINGYHHKIMRWTAVAGWACVILLLAFGDKL